jgi:hypothetical protein
VFPRHKILPTSLRRTGANANPAVPSYGGTLFLLARLNKKVKRLS